MSQSTSARLLPFLLIGCTMEPASMQAASFRSEKVSTDTLTLDDAALEDHWIVRLSSAESCPASDTDWIITSLFSEDNEGDIPGSLARYCVFVGRTGGLPAPSSYGDASHDHLGIAGMSRQKIRFWRAPGTRSSPSPTSPQSPTPWHDW